MTHVRIIGPALQVPPVYGENIIISNSKVVVSEICTETFLFNFPCNKDIQVFNRSLLFLKDKSIIYFYKVNGKSKKKEDRDNSSVNN